MCKCDKKENVNEAMEVVIDIVDLLESIFGTTNKTKKWAKSVDLDKEIDHVVFNDPATIVFWKDGTKTVTKCHSGDTFDKETGLAMCIVRKLTGNRNYNKVFEKYCK